MRTIHEKMSQDDKDAIQEAIFDCLSNGDGHVRPSDLVFYLRKRDILLMTEEPE